MCMVEHKGWQIEAIARLEGHCYKPKVGIVAAAAAPLVAGLPSVALVMPPKLQLAAAKARVQKRLHSEFVVQHW